MIAFLRTVADLCISNMLWILCALPLVTAGASTVALYRCTLSIAAGEGTSMRMFFSAFRSGFRQGSLLGVLYLAVGADFVLLALMIRNAVPEGVKRFLWPVLVLLFLLWAFSASWLFPLIARYENTTKRTLVNSFVYSLKYMPRTLLMTTLNLLPIAVALLFVQVFVYGFLFLVLFGFALIAWVNSMLLLGPFHYEVER